MAFLFAPEAPIAIVPPVIVIIPDSDDGGFRAKSRICGVMFELLIARFADGESCVVGVDIVTEPYPEVGCIAFDEGPVAEVFGSIVARAKGDARERFGFERRQEFGI